jgi:anthranilate/para-aminobenzoate synthase component I
MEIIAQVEGRARGPYTGSIGIFGRDGHASWNIAIRTAVWSRGELAFGCGGGIVLDSDPQQEHAEAVLKARSFFDTLEHLASARKPTRAATGAS